MVILTSQLQEEYKKCVPKLTISYGMHETPFGKCIIGICDDGICHLSFQDDIITGLTTMQTEWLNAELVENHDKTRYVVKNIFDKKELDMKLFTVGTEFQNLVWRALLKIPVGTTTSYENLASLIGKPTAVRAVSNAIARNKIGYLIPCHRVISKSGKIHKYRWGPDRKKQILDFEKNYGSNCNLAKIKV